MKKIICLILIAVFCFGFCGNSIYAEEDNLGYDIISSETISNNNRTILKDVFNIGGKIYSRLEVSNYIYIYDENSYLIAIGLNINSNDEIAHNDEYFEQICQNGDRGVGDSYDRWLSWYDYSTKQLILTSIPGTVSDLANIIKVLFASESNRMINFASAIYSLCSIIINTMNTNQWYYISAQVSNNQYCNILRKERFTQGSSSGSTQIHWLDSPWIYNAVPEACRFLTEIYPY